MCASLLLHPPLFVRKQAPGFISSGRKLRDGSRWFPRTFVRAPPVDDCGLHGVGEQVRM
jgi:hypothetical protein